MLNYHNPLSLSNSLPFAHRFAVAGQHSTGECETMAATPALLTGSDPYAHISAADRSMLPPGSLDLSNQIPRFRYDDPMLIKRMNDGLPGILVGSNLIDPIRK